MAALRLFLVLVLLGVTCGEDDGVFPYTAIKVNTDELLIKCKPETGRKTVAWKFTPLGGSVLDICPNGQSECTNSTKHTMDTATGLNITMIEVTDAGMYECVTETTTLADEVKANYKGELAVAPQLTCTPLKALVGEEVEIVCDFNVIGKKDKFGSTLATIVKGLDGVLEHNNCSKAQAEETDLNHQQDIFCVTPEKEEELSVESLATFDNPFVNREGIPQTYSGTLTVESGAPAVLVSWLLLVVCALLATKL